MNADNLAEPEDVITYEVQFITRDNCLGEIYNITCPECNEIITKAQYLDTRETCACGHVWYSVQTVAKAFRSR